MKQYSVIPIRLGSATETPVPDPVLEFYQWVARSVLTEACELVPSTPQTLPFENSLILNAQARIYSRFLAYVSTWSEAPDLVVVDLTSVRHSVVRGGFLVHLAHAIQVSLDEPRLNATRFVLLLPVIPPPGDAFRELVEPLGTAGRMIVIGDRGDVFPVDSCIRFNPPQEYEVRLARVRENPLSGLKMKLIRRLGHFARFDATQTHTHCARYFFDGTLCKVEVTQLLREYLVATYADHETPVVLYHVTVSNWLEDPLNAAALERGYKCINVADVDLYAGGGSVDHTHSRPLIVVPLVDTGETLAEVYRKVRATLGNVQPHVLTVLTTDTTDPGAQQRVCLIDGVEVQVTYFLEIAQRKYEVGMCPMCGLDLRLSSSTREEYKMLTTYDMWEMAFEAGWKPEDDPPSYRTALSKVPDFPVLLDGNGAWIASKVRERLEMIPGGTNGDVSIICPLEKGSIVLTDYLMMFTDATVVRVPREVINACIEAAGIDECDAEWRKSKPDWYGALSSASSQEFIVMDEFNRTGTTRTAVRNLLEHFGKSVLCNFSLVDFDPEASSRATVPSYSLYEFQMLVE